ncbi:hypothetical protein [Legionella bozemanae]|uniref:Uncharacterized protein n=1 Tax=Legionella bozemanae TaxID=447 RepID=A0A0W0RRL6_LEGBO|nr:hypothetical protein [Legionella bozemanae]KTC73704.1 hypothetical protein Lboz_2350 [Legionella bozemanae]STO33994.1 Uncharacterised protein [Legionella bozemanae]
MLTYILQKLIPETAVISDDKWSESEKILFAPSMSSKCTEHLDTFKYALKKLKIGEEDHVISFLNTIKVYDHPHFLYIDPGKDWKKLLKL